MAVVNELVISAGATAMTVTPTQIYTIMSYAGIPDNPKSWIDLKLVGSGRVAKIEYCCYPENATTASNQFFIFYFYGSLRTGYYSSITIEAGGSLHIYYV